MENRGVAETEDLIDFVCVALDAWSAVYDDNSIDVSDIPAIWKAVVKIGPLLENANCIPAEVKDLTPEETAHLQKYILDSIEIKEEQAKVMLEKVLTALRSVHEVYLLLRD